jgi:hypothetical protein
MAFELLTNFKKYPTTANIEISSNIIKNLFPAMKIEGPADSSHFNENEFNSIDKQLGIKSE